MTVAIQRAQARIAALDDRGWRRLVFGAALGGLAVRLAIIAARHSGGFNLREYWYFSHLAAHGINPYHAPAHGPVSPGDGNNPPLELVLLGALLRLHDSPTTIRVVFAILEAGMILGAGLWFPRSRPWRAMFVVFLAFNPFVLLVWTAFTSDKVLVLGPLLVVLAAVDDGRVRTAWAGATAMAAVKWVGGFFVLPLIEFTRRVAGVRTLAVSAGVAGTVFVVANLPWFPDTLEAYRRRNARIGIPHPIHASLTQLLDRVGIYDPGIVRPFIVVTVVLVFLLYLRGRLRIGEAIALSIVAACIALPDEGADRILMLVLPLLAVTAMTARRWLIVWGLTVVAAGAYTVQTLGGLHGLRGVVGAYGSTGHVVEMNLALVALLWWVWRDVRARREAV